MASSAAQHVREAADQQGLTRDALTAYVATEYGRLIGLASLVCRRAAEPADVVQSALEQAWRHRSDLRDRDRLRPWLDRIVVRQAIRSNRPLGWLRTRRPALDADLEMLPSGEPEPGAWLALRSALDSLSREQRAVVALHLYAGYSVEETATLTGAGTETTRSRLRLAKQRLRRTMTEDER